MPLLLLLALGSFTLGMGAFAVIGVMTPMSIALSLTPVEASGLIGSYAIAYAIGSPLLTAWTGRLPRRTVLVAGMSLFALGLLGTALSETALQLYGARIVSAFGAGLFSPGAAAVAVAVSKAEDRGRALAIVFGGLTLANVIGVPFAGWLGYRFGWSVVFILLTATGFVMTALLAWRVPGNLTVAPVQIADLARTLMDARLAIAILLTATAMGAGWLPFTFLAPLIEAKTGGGPEVVAALLAAYGLGSFIGNFAGGLLADRLGPTRALAAILIAQIPVTSAVTVLPWDATAGGALLAVWGAVGWAYMVPQQSRLVGLDPSRAQVLLSLNAACIYIGAAIGAAAAGQTKTWFGLNALGPAAAIVVGLALVQLFGSHVMMKRARTM